MKKYSFLLACLFLLGNVAYTAVLVVDNNPNSPAPYSTLQAAYTAASSGDTIMVHSSPIDYNGCLTITKKIIFIGPGHRPNKQNSNPANLTGCGPLMNFNAGSSGSALIGFKISSSLNIDASTDSLYIADNFITGHISLQGSHHIIEGNVFYGNGYTFLQYGTVTNVFIRNNVINGLVQSVSGGTIEIDHNIFTRSGGCFNNVSNVMIKNNIFHNSNPSGTGSATFINNITFQTTDTLPTAGNFGSGNINNTDPQFVTAPTSIPYFSYGHDYHLQVTSVGKNAASDGTDIGVYGGLGTFNKYGTPPIPEVNYFNILNATVPAGGNLIIELILKSHQ